MGKIKIAAYQFAGGGSIDENFLKIKNGIQKAAQEKVRILAFHECALTGYPPVECSFNAIDFEKAETYCCQIKELAKEYGIFIFLGCIDLKNGAAYNAVRVFSPSGEELTPYHKRALWGWDRESFREGENCGIYEIDGIKVGVRICFEIRFPEYFRELYGNVDLGIVSFCDISEENKPDRYNLIKGHLLTRAVENVLPILSVNDAAKYQTAPTAFFDAYGHTLCEAKTGMEELLVYEFSRHTDNFGTNGIKFINGKLF